MYGQIPRGSRRGFSPLSPRRGEGPGREAGRGAAQTPPPNPSPKRGGGARPELRAKSTPRVRLTIVHLPGRWYGYDAPHATIPEAIRASIASPCHCRICSSPASPRPHRRPPRKPSPSGKIQQAIEELGSERFTVRERASKFLWEAGAAAEDALRAAAKSKDEETSNRAKTILEKFDWGLYPDTPAEVVKLIEKFRGGDASTRQEAVGELMRMKPTRFATLRKLIAQEHDETPASRCISRWRSRLAGPCRD